jgi:hypothetical protein
VFCNGFPYEIGLVQIENNFRAPKLGDRLRWRSRSLKKRAQFLRQNTNTLAVQFFGDGSLLLLYRSCVSSGYLLSSPGYRTAMQITLNSDSLYVYGGCMQIPMIQGVLRLDK